jgi:hypothetical protein
MPSPHFSRVDSRPPLDPSAYRPATELMGTIPRLNTYRRVVAALAANPWISRYHPRPNRLSVHVGHWFALRKLLADAAVRRFA